jgi:hypothetical protein
MNDYMDDCVHLKACRRFSKMARNKGVKLSRGCGENCSAYEREHDGRLYTEQEVREIINGTVRDVEYGIHDPYDILPGDFV